mmetsp:Transcript_13927/g.50717  ORF Transcript_13927/g.50717 Transcript_13927/m.50717 type:complete len:482 (-) Transcript_13927:185-1630(-)
MSTNGNHNATKLALDGVNPAVLDMEYAVRGAIVTRAGEIEAELKRRPDAFGFDRVVFLNIGNPQALQQPPITFFREVLALCDHPSLLQHPKVEELFSADSVSRAKELLAHLPGGVGAYSASQGVRFLREGIAAAIAERDGYACNPDDLFLTDGASPGCHLMMKILIRSPADGILIPVPQYPLYSACATLYNGTMVPYYLDESRQWANDMDSIREATERARAQGVRVRAIVVINPGNPTGNTLTRENQEDLVRYAQQEGLVIMADEVYQENVYKTGVKWHSFKQVVSEMGADVQVASMHSASKGYYGECGKRGGYLEMYNFDPAVKQCVVKLASVALCANVSGQILMWLIMNPPKEGDASYELFAKERNAIIDSYRRRARVVVDGLRKVDSFTCNDVDGALYAFPQLKLAPGLLAKAKEAGMPGDTYYCLRLLEETGVVLVPGSGFKQYPDTFHFRTTILLPEEQLQKVIERIAEFDQQFNR